MTTTIMGGISAPLLTPYHENGEVNYEEYERLTEYVTGAGIHGVFVGGTTGEFVNLTLDERKKLLSAAKKGAVLGAKVMFNVTAMNLRDLQELLDWAGENGADAVSVTAPYYHKYDEEALVSYFCKVAKMADGQPLYLYNMPGMTHNPIKTSILQRVTEKCENLKGIKDSSMDFMTLLEFECEIDKPGFEIITGNDAQVLPALQSGGAGALIAMASVFPKLCRSIWDLYQEGDLEGAMKAQKTVLKLRSLVRSIMPVMSHKAMVERFGFSMGPARFPMRELTGTERQKVYSVMEELDLLPAAEA